MVAATTKGRFYILGRTPGAMQEAHARVLFRLDEGGAFAALPLSETCAPTRANYELVTQGETLFVLESKRVPEGFAERVFVLSADVAATPPSVTP